MNTTQELTKLNIPSLAASASQLQVVLDIDKQLLAEELNPYVTGLASLEISARSLKVSDDETNNQAVAILNDAATREKHLAAIWARYKTPLNAARAVVLDLEKKTSGVAEIIKKLASSKSGAYLTERRRVQQQVNARVARTVDQEQDRLRQEGEQLILEGDVKVGRQKLAEADMLVAPTLPDMVQAPEGARVTPKFKGTPVDLMATLKAIVEGKIPLVYEVRPGDERPLVAVDQVVLNAIVSRHGGATRIPGVQVDEVTQVGAKGGR